MAWKNTLRNIKLVGFYEWYFFYWDFFFFLKNNSIFITSMKNLSYKWDKVPKYELEEEVSKYKSIVWIYLSPFSLF